MKWGRYGFDSKKFGIVAGGVRVVVTVCVVEEIMKVKQNPESFSMTLGVNVLSMSGVDIILQGR